RDVLGGDGGAGCKIRNRASDTQHAVIRARREQEAGERMAQELIAVPVGRAMTVYLTRAEECVGLVLARELRLVRLRHPAANSARCFAGHRRHQLCFSRRRRGAVMRCAKWPLSPIYYLEALARDRVDRGDFERLGLR